jgi:hypothetical protein
MIKWIKDVASSIFYDDQVIPTNLGDTIQDAIDNIYQQTQVAASPGFTWGRSGTSTPNTWLLNDSVPSNNSGRTVFLNNAEIQNIFVANQDATAGIDLGIYSHEGDEVNLTLLGTVTTAATRSNTFSVAFSIAVDKQIAIKIMPGSSQSKNIVVGALIRGSN